MDEKFVMNIVMPDKIPGGLETVVERLRPSMLYSDQVILNCSELNKLADAYNKYGEEYRAMYIEDRRDMIDSVKDALAKNPGKTIQIKGVRGKVILQSQGKEFFTWPGKDFFT